MILAGISLRAGEPLAVVTKIAVSVSSPNTVFVAVSQYSFVTQNPSDFGTAISMSPDGGQTWRPLYSNSVFVSDITTARTTPETIFAPFYREAPDFVYGGIALSRDAGNTWEDLPSFPDLLPEHIAVSLIDPGTLLVAAGGQIYRSADAGDSWALTNDFGEQAVSDLLFEPFSSTAYAAVGGVFRSGDGGQTWQSFNDGLTDLNVTALAISSGQGREPDLLYAGSASGSIFVASVPSGRGLILPVVPPRRVPIVGRVRLPAKTTSLVRPNR